MATSQLHVENGVAAVVVEAGKSDESFSRGFLDLALRWPDSLDGTRLRVEHQRAEVGTLTQTYQRNGFNILPTLSTSSRR